MNNKIKRTEYIENRTSVHDVHDAMITAWNNNVKAEHPYDSFNFDNSKVSTQMAAVDAALSTYIDPLINGLVNDVDASIAQLKTALEIAGIKDVLAELEAQAAAHVAGK